MSLRVSTSRPLISACSGLMYSGVPIIWANRVKSVFSVSRWSIALATPKSITLGTGLPSWSVTSTFDRLDVAVDDPFLMGVLHGLADRDETAPAARACVEIVLVAVLGDRDPADQLHHEVGPARLGGPRVEHPGDVRMVHQGQGLPLGLEAGDHLLGVHARLDDLQGHLAADRLLLLGHVDHAHAAFADLLQQLVGADDRAGSFRYRGHFDGR